MAVLLHFVAVLTLSVTSVPVQGLLSYTALRQDIYANFNFSVSFSEKPVVREELEGGIELLLGDERKPYWCVLPLSPAHLDVHGNKEKPAETKEGGVAKVAVELGTETLQSLRNGLQLLEEMKGSCLVYSQAIWTYEMCYKDVAFQHLDPSNVFEQFLNGGERDDGNDMEVQPRIPRVYEASYVIGQYRPLKYGILPEERKVDDPLVGEDLTVSASSIEIGDNKYALVQRWTDGEYCEVIDSNRVTEVQFYCNSNITHDQIILVREVSMCRYLIVVHTPRLCAEPLFTRALHVDQQPIQCHPIVDSLPNAADSIEGDGDGQQAAPEPDSAKEEAVETMDTRLKYLKQVKKTLSRMIKLVQLQRQAVDNGDNPNATEIREKIDRAQEEMISALWKGIDNISVHIVEQAKSGDGQQEGKKREKDRRRRVNFDSARILRMNSAGNFEVVRDHEDAASDEDRDRDLDNTLELIKSYLKSGGFRTPSETKERSAKEEADIDEDDES